ncbi:MAG: hypothetical protein INR73_19005 [Williamsia sp.]|nr:hypothetical protein [Williamsia sp.]
MKAKEWIILLCISSGSLFTSSLLAQEYIYNHLSTKDGLLSNNILSLWQDKRGFLWIGSESGLQRYDGYHFIAPDVPAVRRHVDQILSDKKGRMWLRMGKTVGIFDPSTFLFRETKINEPVNPPGPPIYDLRLDSEGRVYFLVSGVGCFYASEDGQMLSGKYNPFTLPNVNGLLGVTDDPVKKRFWVNSMEGLGYIDKASRQYHSFSYNPLHHPLLSDMRFNSGVINFFIDSRRRYWLTTWNNAAGGFDFYCFDEKTGTFSHDTSGLSAAGKGSYFEVNRFTQFNDTTVLMYGINCMSMQKNGRFTDLRHPVQSSYSLQFSVINQVLEDKEHILWIASDDGLYNTMANLRSSQHLMLEQNRENLGINCLLEDGERNIWIGTWGRGIIVLDSALLPRKDINLYDRIPLDGNHNVVWDIHQPAGSAEIWIACQKGVLLIYDLFKNSMKTFQPALFNSSAIRQITEDQQGNLWLGLQNGLLASCRKQHAGSAELSFQAVHHFKGLISKLTVDTEGSLWVAVAGQGLFKVDVTSGRVVKSLKAGEERTSLSGNEIRDILPLTDSLLALAGDVLDLLHIRTGYTEHISSYNGVPIGKVYALQCGAGHDCWLSTSNGMYKYNYQSGSLIRYTQWDGLITVFNKRFIMESSIRLRNGHLAFGGNQNFVSFDPAQYKNIIRPADVQITGFQVLNNTLPVDSLLRLKNIRLDYTANSFTIEFASLSFTQLEKLTYEYKLEGADKDWTGVKLPTPVKYSQIAPGTYDFLVRAKSSEEIYSGNITRVRIVILPPFWKSYPFFTCIVLLAGALLYYLHRMKLKRVLQVEQVRSKLARDLHDDIGSTLSTINILSSIALQQDKLDDGTSKNFMGKISESTSQMMESMDDIIWSINPLNDSIGKVLARMKQVAGGLLESKGIEYNFEAEEAVKQLSFNMEWRREIFLIYKEAINNIVKYANCTQVDVKLRKREHAFELSICDNGIGFDKAVKADSCQVRGNGLVNMSKRADAMKGNLQISSEKDGGTQIFLTIPFT